MSRSIILFRIDMRDLETVLLLRKQYASSRILDSEVSNDGEG